VYHADPATTKALRTTTAPIIRSIDMHLINEALARAHCMEQRYVAERDRHAYRLVARRRMERKAARAARRARRLATAVVAMNDRPL